MKMILTRRNMAAAIPTFLTIGALSACATSNTSTNQVPTLSQVQSWVAIINSELPAFIAESEATGLLTGSNDDKAKQALATFQQLANQFLSPTFNVTNTAVLVSEIGTILTTILTVIPSTAPYVGFIQLGVLVISAFLASTPISVPPMPASTSLKSMHLAIHK